MTLASLIWRSFSQLSVSLMLLSFLFLIAFGNLLRLMPLFGHWNNLLITEVSLYFFGFFSFSELFKDKQFVRQLFLFLAFIFVSFLYGTLKYGYDSMALLYGVRLFMLIYTAKVLGYACIKRFQGQVVPFFSWLLKGYVIAIFTSSIIYFLFPHADRLWQFLMGYNIKFQGDPHCDRFVSVYFDPNFYGAIGCIPFLLSSFLFSFTKKERYFIFSLLIAGSIFLTQSRSGIALFCALIGWMGLLHFRNVKSLCSFSRKQLVVFLSTMGFGMGVLVYKGVFTQVLSRLQGISHDPSAGFRFLAWKEGLEALCQAPLLGIGYNFVHRLGVWVDSSLLLACITWGVCLTLCFLAYGCFLLRNLYLKYRGTALQTLISCFIFYIFSSVFFYSFFNNLVFYLFWALPVLVIYHFLKERAVCE